MISRGDLSDERILPRCCRYHFDKCHEVTPPVQRPCLRPSRASPHRRSTSGPPGTAKRCLGVGAMKPLDARPHGEVKSMHTAQRRPAAAASAAPCSGHIIETSREQGPQPASACETGSFGYFEPAVALYKAHGFEECAPFGDYKPDPQQRVPDARDLAPQLPSSRRSAEDHAFCRTPRCSPCPGVTGASVPLPPKRIRRVKPGEGEKLVSVQASLSPLHRKPRRLPGLDAAVEDIDLGIGAAGQRARVHARAGARLAVEDDGGRTADRRSADAARAARSSRRECSRRRIHSPRGHRREVRPRRPASWLPRR